MPVSILFRTPTQDGFAVEGFTDKAGNLLADVVATYVKDASDKAIKKYAYDCTGASIKGTRRIVVDKHHATWGAATAVLKALGMSQDAKPADGATFTRAQLEAMLKAMDASDAPAPKRGRTARK